MASAEGRNLFHVRYIRWSYRIRGSVARIQMNAKLMMNVVKGIVIAGLGKKRAVVKSLIARMFVYSAIKIRANELLLYSILNPETNSDSPSDRSNGVRLVSARTVINHKTVIGIITNAGVDLISIVCELKLNVLVKAINEIKIRAILISYEMV